MLLKDTIERVINKLGKKVSVELPSGTISKISQRFGYKTYVQHYPDGERNFYQFKLADQSKELISSTFDAGYKLGAYDVILGLLDDTQEGTGRNVALKAMQDDLKQKHKQLNGSLEVHMEALMKLQDELITAVETRMYPMKDCVD